MKNINNSIKNKPIINGVVIVEGKTDTIKLKKIFNVQTIETNGLNLTHDTMNLILETSKNNDIILFLDPDGPGEKIRKMIIDKIPHTKNVFISIKDINFNNNSKNKIGVAEAYDNAIIKAFENLVIFDKASSTISWEQYLKLNLNSKNKRKVITDYFNISLCNNKQLFKRLNMMGIKYETLKGIINE